MKYFFQIVFLFFPFFVFAQIPADSAFIKDSLKIARIQLVRPQFKLDDRVTFSEGQALSINGFDAGVLLSEKLRLTLGYYSMNGHLKTYDYTSGEDEFGRFVEMKYGSINTELIYKDTRFLSFGMPLEIGAGVNRLRTKNINTAEIISSQTGGLVFVNFGMSAAFKPMRFLGLKAMVGYRKVAYNQVKDFNFDGFFTSIGFNIDLHAVVVDVRMYKLEKRYHRGNNIANAVDIITK